MSAFGRINGPKKEAATGGGGAGIQKEELQNVFHQTKCNFTQFIYIRKQLFMFRVVPLPAGSSNCVTNTRCCRYSCMRS
jgi:hypothetical protein